MASVEVKADGKGAKIASAPEEASVGRLQIARNLELLARVVLPGATLVKPPENLANHWAAKLPLLR